MSDITWYGLMSLTGIHLTWPTGRMRLETDVLTIADGEIMSWNIIARTTPPSSMEILVITAKDQKFGSREYTSSRLITKGKKQFKFGRIDIRAALPEGQGLWPALWMLGSNIDAVSWPACGEIDIMELSGDLPNRVVGTVHYGPNSSSAQYNSMSKYLDGDNNFQDEFHVFSINWENNLIQFFVDDVLYHTITPASLNGEAYPFNKNFFFIFNVAVGGNFPGNPDGSTPFPQHMIVDYVRVFQK